MTVEAWKERLLRFEPYEEVYRRLYLAQPEVYDYRKNGALFEDWAEFTDLYMQNGPVETEIPHNAPTIMGNTLMEQTFFADAKRDVSLVLNARYCPPFWHHLNFIKIMYVLGGSLQFNISEKEQIILEKGNFLLSPPNLQQSVFSCHDEDIVINVFLRATTFEQAFSSLVSGSNSLAPFFWKIMYGKDQSNLIWFRTQTDPRLDQLICEMLDEWMSPQPGGNFYLIGNVMAFLGHAMYDHREDICSLWNTRMQRQSFPEVIQYIHEHYAEITLPGLADHFQKSEGYMSRYIKDQTGYSLTELLRRIRMREAGKLVRDTELSMTEIMYRIGYTDISYFYKTFREHYHMTPMEFRKKDKVVLL